MQVRFDRLGKVQLAGPKSNLFYQFARAPTGVDKIKKENRPWGRGNGYRIQSITNEMAPQPLALFVRSLDPRIIVRKGDVFER